jgi:serine phosphatase RsbU (regulator of sigma subunit)
MSVPPLPRAGSGRFLKDYVQGLTTADLERLFTRDTPDAYRFFSRGIDIESLKRMPWYKRLYQHGRLLFLAFTLKLTPARRAIYGMSLMATLVGLMYLYRGVQLLLVPHPIFANGALWMLTGFLLINLLVLLEVADRLSLKRDLEVAREIQNAMLPEGTWSGPGVEAFGLTKPANTVGGDFYDILPQPDGTVIVALGDVAGKASPAALLMALLLAILRTLVDENMPLPALVKRLNSQVARHAPASRFITLFLASFHPATGRLEFVNAGQTPPLLRRQNGTIERLMSGGIALGMFEGSTYESGELQLHPGDALLMYSDGLTEAESPDGQPFDEAGLERTLALYAGAYQKSAAAELGKAVFDAVERHRRDQRLQDDLTVLVLSRLA